MLGDYHFGDHYQLNQYQVQCPQIVPPVLKSMPLDLCSYLLNSITLPHVDLKYIIGMLHIFLVWDQTLEAL